MKYEYLYNNLVKIVSKGSFYYGSYGTVVDWFSSDGAIKFLVQLEKPLGTDHSAPMVGFFAAELNHKGTK